MIQLLEMPFRLQLPHPVIFEGEDNTPDACKWAFGGGLPGFGHLYVQI